MKRTNILNNIKIFLPIYVIFFLYNTQKSYFINEVFLLKTENKFLILMLYLVFCYLFIYLISNVLEQSLKFSKYIFCRGESLKIYFKILINEYVGFIITVILLEFIMMFIYKFENIGIKNVYEYYLFTLLFLYIFVFYHYIRLKFNSKNYAELITFVKLGIIGYIRIYWSSFDYLKEGIIIQILLIIFIVIFWNQIIKFLKGDVIW